METDQASTWHALTDISQPYTFEIMFEYIEKNNGYEATRTNYVDVRAVNETDGRTQVIDAMVTEYGPINIIDLEMVEPGDFN